jgi:hypothetical protein
MPKAYLKFVQKSAYRIKLISLIEDLAENNLNAYDLVKNEMI